MTTYTDIGDSNPGSSDVNNPFEEDVTGGGNICDVLFEGKCYVQDCTHPPQTYHSTNTYPDDISTYYIGEEITNPGMDNSAGSLTFSVEEMQYSVIFEEGYNLYDERYESWLKINHSDAVSKPSTASSSQLQISDAHQAPMSFGASLSEPRIHEVQEAVLYVYIYIYIYIIVCLWSDHFSEERVKF